MITWLPTILETWSRPGIKCELSSHVTPPKKRGRFAPLGSLIRTFGKSARVQIFTFPWNRQKEQVSIGIPVGIWSLFVLDSSRSHSLGWTETEGTFSRVQQRVCPLASVQFAVVQPEPGPAESRGEIGENCHRSATQTTNKCARDPHSIQWQWYEISDHYYGYVPCLLGREFQFTASKARKVSQSPAHVGTFIDCTDGESLLVTLKTTSFSWRKCDVCTYRLAAIMMFKNDRTLFIDWSKFSIRWLQARSTDSARFNSQIYAFNLT